MAVLSRDVRFTRRLLAFLVLWPVTLAGFSVAALHLTGPRSWSAPERPAERVFPAPECNPGAVVWRTPEPPPKPQRGDVWANPQDGMGLVYIPGGDFVMGSSDADKAAWQKEHPGASRVLFTDEQPQRRVHLDAFWLGRTEVTNAQYLRFVQATGHKPPDQWKGGRISAGQENLPVGGVTWDDARAYCQWAGGHLPTEAQWEKAARGGDSRTFPWGFRWYTDVCALGSDAPARVGSNINDASPYGCLDMGGNMWEWCADWYAGDYYREAPRQNPPGPGPEPGQDLWRYRVMRSGCWATTDVASFRCSARRGQNPGIGSAAHGFRCAFSARR